MADKKKYKIVKDTDGEYYVYSSDDNWVTQNKEEKATSDEIKDYEYHQAEKAAGYKESEAYGPKGLAKLNELRANVNLGPATDVKTGIKELQEYSGKNYNELVADYMINRSPKPNARLEGKLKALGYPTTKEGAKKAYEDGALTKDQVIDSYKDSQWWFRAIAPKKVKVSREEYDRLLKRPGAVKQGNSAFFVEDANKPHEYTEYVPEDAAPKDQDITLTKEQEAAAAQTVRRNPIVAGNPPTYAPWWLQDIVKISGAAADKARIKKYLPYQQVPEVRLPEATFYDPTRELAANAEQANIQTQAMAAFTGPQALSARSSSIQGQALKNAADIESRYNNLNVGIANQLNQERTGIMNQAAQNRAGLNTQLWDKYTIANQNFDNSKAQARQNIRQSYIDGITNRAKTQALNTLYPNYYTDPSRGGFVNFNPGYGPFTPNQVDNTNEYYKAVKLTGDPDRALKYLQLMKTGKVDGDSMMPYQGYQGSSQPQVKQSNDGYST